MWPIGPMMSVLSQASRRKSDDRHVGCALSIKSEAPHFDGRVQERKGGRTGVMVQGDGDWGRRSVRPSANDECCSQQSRYSNYYMVATGRFARGRFVSSSRRRKDGAWRRHEPLDFHILCVFTANSARMFSVRSALLGFLSINPPIILPVSFIDEAAPPPVVGTFTRYS